MALTLLVPATIILVWKIVSEKLKRKSLSSDLITVSLVLGLAIIGLTQLNIERSLNWLHWVLLVVQLLMLVFLWETALVAVNAKNVRVKRFDPQR